MKKIQKTLSLTLIAFLICGVVFGIFEPQGTKAADDSIDVTQEVTAEISITSPSNIDMSPDIPGMTGNPGSPASGEVTWTVKTSNATGFNMKLKAGADPALSLDATYEFTDYTPVSAATPDYTWASPAGSAAEFGFTVQPATVGDTVQLFKDDGAACDAGDLNTADKCWYDFNGINDIDVINRTTNTDSAGEAEVFRFQAESNAKFLKAGDYTATITATAAMN